MTRDLLTYVIFVGARSHGRCGRLGGRVWAVPRSWELERALLGALHEKRGVWREN